MIHSLLAGMGSGWEPCTHPKLFRTQTQPDAYGFGDMGRASNVSGRSWREGKAGEPSNVCSWGKLPGGHRKELLPRKSLRSAEGLNRTLSICIGLLVSE